MSFRRVWVRFVTARNVVIFALFLLTAAFLFYESHKKVETGMVVNMARVISRTGPDAPPIKSRACVHPQLEINNEEILKHFGKEIDVKCPQEKNWVDVDNGTFVISQEAIQKHGVIKCAFTSILRGRDDFTWSYGPVVSPFESGRKIPTDFFNVTCYGQDKAKYANVHQAISFQPELHKNDPKKKLLPNSIGTNVLIIGLDSVSRLMWLRKLPQVDRFLNTELGAITLEGANIMGDGTPAATFPLLTGKAEEELPECRRKVKGAVPLDDFPFIWKEFKKIGYITQMAEDYSDVAMFTYRLRGFNTQPTDHFARPYYLVTEEKYSSAPKPHCTGSEPNSALDLRWISDTYKMYPNKLKFMFYFLAEFTHSRGRVLFQHIDNEMTKFLRKFKESGHLDNTILIVMSDHGCRFSELRETAQGKQEERLPYVSVVFPPWFQNKYPKAYENVKSNSRGLTTVTDLHEMLLDIVNFRTDAIGDSSQKGISLFREIPTSRTCKDAGIADHWCACLDWHQEDTDEASVKEIALKIVAYFNELLRPAAEYCEQLSLKAITKAHRLIPNEKVLKFKGSSDPDGRVGDFSDITKANVVTYQIALTTSPNNGHFEVSVQYEVIKQQIILDEHFISRTNKYGEDPRCIMEKFTQIRKYCLCKPEYQKTP